MTANRAAATVLIVLLLTAALPIAAADERSDDPVDRLRRMLHADPAPDRLRLDGAPTDARTLLDLLPVETGDAQPVQGHAVGVGARDPNATACIRGAYIAAYTVSSGGFVDPITQTTTGLQPPTDPDGLTCDDRTPYVLGTAEGGIHPSAGRVACAERDDVQGQTVGGWADDPAGDPCRAGFAAFTVTGHIAEIEVRSVDCNWFTCFYVQTDFLLGTVPEETSRAGVLEVRG